jgi:uncharacterized membrane protein
MLLGLGIMRYTGYNAAMLDIGNMAQAIGSVLQGRPLEYTPPQFTWEQGNTSRLALHVELVYFLLTPLYALFPDPRTLLVVQAIWFGLGAWPVYRMARRRLNGSKWSLALVLIYLFYPAAQTAVLFDFHGDTLAMPALLFALDALDRRAWRSYAVWILLALSCKFYVAMPIVVLGAVLWWHGEKRAGALTSLAGVVWLIFTLGILSPAFKPPLAEQSHATFASYLEFYFGAMGKQMIATAPLRLLTALVVFLPGLWLGRFAWHWVLPALAIALPALISQGQDHASFDFRFHHYAVTVPFLYLATLHGLAKLQHRQHDTTSTHRPRRPWQGELFLAAGVTLIFNIGLVDTPLNPRFWANDVNSGLSEWRYGQTSRDRFKDRWLERNVPDCVPLVADAYLAPHLTMRRYLGLINYPEAERFKAILDKMDYAVVDGLSDFSFSLGDGLFVGGALRNVPGLKVLLDHPAYELVTAQDGLLLFERGAETGDGLTQNLRLRTWEQDATRVQGDYAGKIGLLATEVQQNGRHRYNLRFEWVALAPLAQAPPLFAVSRLDGIAHSRIVHLPTQVLYPTTAWRTGEVVEETFEVELPAELSPGTYRLLTGWYNGSNIHAAATDERSRLGTELLTGTITVK